MCGLTMALIHDDVETLQGLLGYAKSGDIDQALAFAIAGVGRGNSASCLEVLLNHVTSIHPAHAVSSFFFVGSEPFQKIIEMIREDITPFTFQGLEVRSLLDCISEIAGIPKIYNELTEISLGLPYENLVTQYGQYTQMQNASSSSPAFYLFIKMYLIELENGGLEWRDVGNFRESVNQLWTAGADVHVSGKDGPPIRLLARYCVSDKNHLLGDEGVHLLVSLMLSYDKWQDCAEFFGENLGESLTVAHYHYVRRSGRRILVPCGSSEPLAAWVSSVKLDRRQDLFSLKLRRPWWLEDLRELISSSSRLEGDRQIYCNHFTLLSWPVQHIYASQLLAAEIMADKRSRNGDEIYNTFFDF